MDYFKSIFKYISCLVFVSALLLCKPSCTNAQLEITSQNGITFQRSLESLRDLDSQTWQVVAYPKGDKEISIVLRIVGYPGNLRLNHSNDLIVKSGIKSWALKDITLKNLQLANDSREAAAEFNLQPLLLDLAQDRPLRLFLPSAFNELPIPPYVVKEWRSLKLEYLNNEDV